MPVFLTQCGFPCEAATRSGNLQTDSQSQPDGLVAWRSNMIVRHVSAILASGVIAALLAGCSQTTREISERKHDVDRQEKAQKQLVQRQTDELNENDDIQRKETLSRLDTQKKKLKLSKELVDQQ